MATIARIPYAHQLLSDPDYLYNFTDLAIWSIVECGIAITASSLATLRPLFIQMRLLANSHLTGRFTGRYGHSRVGSGGLPMQSARSITVITSHGRDMKPKRYTDMTSSTAFSNGTTQTGGLKGVEEGMSGIKVEKEFEMSVMSRESLSDSIDRLEAEVNEAITPGTTKRNSTYEQTNASRRSSYGSRSRLPPLKTVPHSTPPPAENRVSTGSSMSGPRYVSDASTSSLSSPQRRRRPSEEPVPSEAGSATSSHSGHTYTRSDSSSRAPGVTLSPPSFHLPTRLQHQSTLSNPSCLPRFDSRGTFQGLSAPPRVQLSEYGRYSPSQGATSPGSPLSMGASIQRDAHGSVPISYSPSLDSRYPFPKQDTVLEVPKAEQGRKQSVSTFSADRDGSSGPSIEGRQNGIRTQTESSERTRPSPNSSSIPSSWRSNPAGAPGVADWV